MDFENTLSTAADTSETGDAAPAADTSDTPETGSQVIVMQSETSTPSTTRSVSLDAPTVDAAGLPAVVRSVFGDYHQRTQTVTETASDGTSVTSTEPVPGLAGLDWYWLSGVFMFTIVLWSFFRFLGVVFKR
jgi:hypothetical protein